jgi:hypothetical protein
VLHLSTAAQLTLRRLSPTLTLQQSLSLAGGIVSDSSQNHLVLLETPAIPTGKPTNDQRPQGGEGDSGRADPEAPALPSRQPTSMCVAITQVLQGGMSPSQDRWTYPQHLITYILYSVTLLDSYIYLSKISDLCCQTQMYSQEVNSAQTGYWTKPGPRSHADQSNDRLLSVKSKVFIFLFSDLALSILSISVYNPIVL